MPTGLKGPTRYTGHWPKRGGAAPRQFLDVDLFRELPSTPNSYGPESVGIGKVMKLSFQPYKDLLIFGADCFWNPRRKQSPSCRRVGFQRARI